MKIVIDVPENHELISTLELGDIFRKAIKNQTRRAAMCNYTTAKPGYCFILTDKGKQDFRISHKFNPDYVHRKQYKYSVPVKWVNQGYVIEVKA